ncbi:LexA family transcriptional regulator [Pseudomonas sp. UFMG81]|uniref:LexA family transcriptional regulator n=1 Tax=Pseudomonas sp. UFMG81 TaxID=2745936 RepID=UPI00188FC224|nr:helix-turn-helix transcriptional regulator [Pseudomonas sp. UFMG81]
MNTSGDRLKALLQECNLTCSDFAAQRNVTPQHVNNWFKRGVPQARLDEISDLFCVHKRWLRMGEGPKHPDPLKTACQPTLRNEAPPPLLALDTGQVQLPLHRLEQGCLEPVSGLYQTIPRQALDSVRVTPDNAFCIGMPASNMAPQLPLGTLLAIDSSLTQVVEGECYALLHNGRLRVHQLSQGPHNALCLHSHDRLNHPVERYTAAQRKAQNLQILGWVFWWACLRPQRPC